MDKTFDLIEQHRRDWEAFIAGMGGAESERLCNVQGDSFRELFDFIPTTPGGHLANGGTC